MTIDKHLTSATSAARPSGSRDPLVDRLFERMATMYGAKWLDLWTGINVDAVKADWSRALTGVSSEAARLALDHLLRKGGPFPPTQPEFMALVRQFIRHGAYRFAIVDGRRTPPPGGFEALKAILRRTPVATYKGAAR